MCRRPVVHRLETKHLQTGRLSSLSHCGQTLARWWRLLASRAPVGIEGPAWWCARHAFCHPTHGCRGAGSGHGQRHRMAGERERHFFAARWVAKPVKFVAITAPRDHTSVRPVGLVAPAATAACAKCGLGGHGVLNCCSVGGSWEGTCKDRGSRTRRPHTISRPLCCCRPDMRKFANTADPEAA